MPKRRTSAQRVASKRNLVKARAARRSKELPWAMSNDMSKPKGVRDAAYTTGFRPIPTGKNTLLYHKARDADTANRIIKSRKWVSGTKAMGGVPGHSQFTTGWPLKRFNVGSADSIVTVKVPRKLVRNVKHEDQGSWHVVVKNSDLKGRLVRKLR